MTETEKALNYYRSAVEKIRPSFVPSRVRLKNLVAGDLPFHPMVAVAGEHACESNQWGAISVISNTGARLGLKPNEFEVIAWRPNVVAT